MDIEELPQPQHKRKTKVGKHHTDLAVLNKKDAEIEELSSKYELMPHGGVPSNIPPEDISKALEIYATREDVDLTNIADMLHISEHALRRLLSSDKYKDYYQDVKLARGSRFAREGMKIACTPYNKLMEGEDIHPQLVKAATTASNYMLHMAKAFNPEFGSGGGAGGREEQIVVAVQSNFKLNI